MATLRKAKCYRTVIRSYTRKSKQKKKGYIKAVPASRIAKHITGDTKRKFEKEFAIVSKGKIQVRHNAIESCRVMVNRNINKRIGKEYCLRIISFPHQVLRENKMLTGAGADRMQTGMSHGFGKTVGTAAQLKIGSKLITLQVDSKNSLIAKETLKGAIPRLPGKFQITEIR